DGRLASTGRDKVTKLLDQNGAVQKQFEAFPDLGLRVAVTHDSAKVVGGDWSGQVKAWAAADGKAVAALDANPPPAAERLQLARQAVAAGEAKVKQLADALAAAQARAKQAAESLTATQANAQKVAADLAAAQKAATDHTTAATGTAPQLAPAKAEADKLAAASAAAQAKAAALEVT